MILILNGFFFILLVNISFSSFQLLKVSNSWIDSSSSSHSKFHTCQGNLLITRFPCKDQLTLKSYSKLCWIYYKFFIQYYYNLFILFEHLTEQTSLCVWVVFLVPPMKWCVHEASPEYFRLLGEVLKKNKASMYLNAAGENDNKTKKRWTPERSKMRISNSRSSIQITYSLHDAHSFLFTLNISFPRFRVHSHMKIKVMKVQELQTKKNTGWCV